MITIQELEIDVALAGPIPPVPTFSFSGSFVGLALRWVLAANRCGVAIPSGPGGAMIYWKKLYIYTGRELHDASSQVG